jgi:hypothetical protein
MTNLACTVETTTTTAGGLGCPILDLIVVQNAAAKPVVTDVGAGIPEMVIAYDSSQRLSPSGDRNADIGAAVASSSRPRFYCFNFQLSLDGYLPCGLL